MGNTPFGYIIVDGKAVVDEATAEQVRNVYLNYLSGLSLVNAAKRAGLDLRHCGVKNMLQNKHYLGDDFYPQIIDNEIFNAAKMELSERSSRLGRNNRYKPEKIKKPPIAFRLGSITENFDNPIRQAEYIYSLIESGDI